MRQRSTADVIASVAVTAVGIGAGLSCLPLRGTATQQIGPGTAPLCVAAVLALAGAGLSIQAAAGRRDLDDREPEAPAEPRLEPLVPLAIAIIGSILTIGTLGFIPSSALLFAGAARALGRRFLLFDLSIGFAVATVLELIFVRLLGLNLGSGLLSLSQ